MTCNENAGRVHGNRQFVLLLFGFCYCRVAEATCGAQNNDNHFKAALRHIDKQISVFTFFSFAFF